MVKRISLTVGMPFKGTHPIRTGPQFETVEGHVEEIHLASGKVTIAANTVSVNETGPRCWVISMEDAIVKNWHREVEED